MPLRTSTANVRTSAPPVPRRWGLRLGDVKAVLAVNLVLITGMWFRHGGLTQLTDAGGALTAAGQLTGLYGTFAVLVALVLMARMPWLDQLLGTAEIVSWHRWAGLATASLLVAHTVFVTLGLRGEHEERYLVAVLGLRGDVPRRADGDRGSRPVAGGRAPRPLPHDGGSATRRGTSSISTPTSASPWDSRINWPWEPTS